MRNLVALSLLGLSALGSAQIRWTPYTAAGGEFRVMLPGKASQIQHSVSTGTFQIQYSTYIANSADLRCVVTACQIPRTMSREEQARFTSALATGFQTSGEARGVVMSNRVFGNLTGQYISINRQGRQIGIWIVTFNDHIYALAYGAPRDKYLTTETAFFPSFRVSEAKH